MTIVVAAKVGKEIVIGSDYMISLGDSREKLNKSKWFKVGKIWIGYSGTIEPFNELENLSPSDLNKITNPLVLSRFIKGKFEEYNVEVVKENGASLGYNCEIIIVLNKTLYIYDADLNYSEISEGELVCVGSGRHFSLGAWSALECTKFPLEVKLQKCIEAANKYDSMCGFGTYVETLYG